jgi:hypothetical protein
MTVDDDREDKGLFRRGIGFLHQARPLCGLAPGAFARIEKRLEAPPRGARRRPLLLAAATLGMVLVAGTAYAVVNGGLAHLPLVGPWFAPSHADSDRRPQPLRRSHRPAKPPLTVPAGTGVPAAVPVEAAGAPAEERAPADRAAVSPAPAGLAPAAANPGAAAPAAGSKPAPTAPRKVALASPTSVPTSTAPARASAPVLPAPAPVAPAKAANPILDESRSFSAAIERWHRERNASAALAALDEHDQRYAGGWLGMESRLLRAEILLAQGREREGLALLDQVTIAGSPRARELFTVRGELRIKLGRCREGRADLDEVLVKGMADAFARRAAEALAHCPRNEFRGAVTKPGTLSEDKP